MNIEYLGLSEINGPLVAIGGVKDACFDELVEFKTKDSETKLGKIVELYNDKALIQVFEGTSSFSLNNTKTRLLGHTMNIHLSPSILGRVLDGIGRPIDSLGPLSGEIVRDINGLPINPVSRTYPDNYIHTGISAIDCLSTLIRGQKLPIFSADGLPHNKLIGQIISQSKIIDDDNNDFAIVFASMGVGADSANYFREIFRDKGVLDHSVMLINLANDPVIERIITPKIALTIAEYLAFDLEKHVLVILSDMTSYAEALREISSSKGEIPSRKGFPGYLYSEFANIYERAGIVKNKKGSLTQIPILTMPGDDITHPIPDLTGYITEGQIILDRTLYQKNIYPPISVLPSLSRLMKDSIGENKTLKYHSEISSQLLASYAKVSDARNLSSVIGADELSDTDKKYLIFGDRFENEFINQDFDENRTMEDTLKLGLNMLTILPASEITRIDTDVFLHYNITKND